MTNPKLTFLLSTYNKVTYLRQVLERLIPNCIHGDEIIVIDGGSNDGTVKYLGELLNQGLITAFISESDYGEAHGFNKGILMARGELIKFISDDDAFYWSGINLCRDFMLDNPHIDILSSDGGFFDWRHRNLIQASVYKNNYLNYKFHGKPFNFCGLGLFIRRTSIPLLGLFDTNFMRVDAEYSLRVTSGKAQLAWCSNPLWLRILNPSSNSVKQSNRGHIEGEILDQLHHGSIVIHRKILRHIKDLARPIKKIFIRKPSVDITCYDWSEAFAICDAWLEKQNKNVPLEIITKESS